MTVPEPVVVDYDFLRMKSAGPESEPNPPVSMLVRIGEVRQIVHDHDALVALLREAMEWVENDQCSQSAESLRARVRALLSPPVPPEAGGSNG